MTPRQIARLCMLLAGAACMVCLLFGQATAANMCKTCANHCYDSGCDCYVATCMCIGSACNQWGANYIQASEDEPCHRNLPCHPNNNCCACGGGSKCDGNCTAGKHCPTPKKFCGGVECPPDCYRCTHDSYCGIVIIPACSKSACGNCQGDNCYECKCCHTAYCGSPTAAWACDVCTWGCFCCYNCSVTETPP